MKYLLLAILLALPSAALAYEPPVLENPKTCNIFAGGGNCNFGFSEDGIVNFPDEIVYGKVTISGGRNLIVGPGHVKANPGNHYAIAFNSPNNVFIEGMHVDANGQCDAFALRNQRGVQAVFTFKNVFIEGPVYNNPDVLTGSCHGDIIQNQNEGGGGGLTLRLENFIGVTDAQGLFIPCRSSGHCRTELKNVLIRAVPGNGSPLVWFSSPRYNDAPYPVTLEDVWVDHQTDGQFYPETRIIGAQTVTWPSESLITGVINRGSGAWNEAEFKATVGLNYNTPEPDPTPEPEPDPTPDLNLANAATMSANSNNFDPNNPVEGMWDKCVDGSTICSPGDGAITSFWVEYDLGQLYDLTQARLFGDASGTWVSRSWTFEYKANAGDPWTLAFTDDGAFVNDWRVYAVTAQARHVRVTVYGDAATQAREFELLGTVATAPVPDPTPDPTPDPVPDPEPDPIPEPDPVPSVIPQWFTDWCLDTHHQRSCP